MKLRAGWQLVTEEDHFLYWYHLSIWLERKLRYITKDLRASEREIGFKPFPK
jgi:hypothetical protein